jgi:hypothetical protein
MIAADPGRNTGSMLSEQPAQNEGSAGSQNPAGGGGNQGQRHRQGARCGQQQQDQAPRAAKFEGRCDDLTGHVYDYASPRQAADQFTKTTCKICKYVGRMYKYGADTKAVLETLMEPTFAEPTDPAATAT